MISGANGSNFDPAWWLPDGHSQTLWRKFRPELVLTQHRQRVELPDGDFIELDWAKQVAADGSRENTNSLDNAVVHSAAEGEHLIILIHGLCGCAQSSYIVSLQKELLKSGINSVAMNLRGSGNVVNRLARAYHSGASDDLLHVVNALKLAYPAARFSLVGFSLGANLLLKYLAENEVGDQIDKAVAVSTPFELERCSAQMCKGLPRFYGNYFLKSLTATLAQKKAEFERTENLAQLELIRQLGDCTRIDTLWEFDDLVTAPLNGFNDARDYYQRCSSRSFLSLIDTPTLLIQAQDDPIIPLSALPHPTELPESMCLELYAKGGHVGFIARRENWLEQRIVCYLESSV